MAVGLGDLGRASPRHGGCCRRAEHWAARQVAEVAQPGIGIVGEAGGVVDRSGPCERSGLRHRRHWRRTEPGAACAKAEAAQPGTIATASASQAEAGPRHGGGVGGERLRRRCLRLSELSGHRCRRPGCRARGSYPRGHGGCCGGECPRRRRPRLAELAGQRYRRPGRGACGSALRCHGGRGGGDFHLAQRCPGGAAASMGTRGPVSGPPGGMLGLAVRVRRGGGCFRGGREARWSYRPLKAALAPERLERLRCGGLTCGEVCPLHSCVSEAPVASHWALHSTRLKSSIESGIASTLASQRSVTRLPCG